MVHPSIEVKYGTLFIEVSKIQNCSEVFILIPTINQYPNIIIKTLLQPNLSSLLTSQTPYLKNLWGFPVCSATPQH